MGASCKQEKSNSEFEYQEDETYSPRCKYSSSDLKSSRAVSLSKRQSTSVSKKKCFEQTCTFVDVNESLNETKSKLFCDDTPTCEKPKKRRASLNWEGLTILGLNSSKFLDFDSSDSDQYVSGSERLDSGDWKLQLKDSSQKEKLDSPCSTYSSSGTTTPTYTPNKITEVIPGKLYLGCENKAGNEDELLSLGITHILSVTNRVHPVKGMEHEHFVMNDMGKTELNDVLDKVYPYMERAQQAENKLFVHCTLGQNRSPTLVISFLMKNNRQTLYEAYTMLKKMRPLVQIHRNYAKMLLKLEMDIFGETSLPDDWMKQDGRDLSTGLPSFISEEMTVEEQRMFKHSQNLEKSSGLKITRQM